MSTANNNHFDRMFGCEFRYVEWVIVAWGYLWAIWLLFVVDTMRDAYVLMREMASVVGLDPSLTPYLWGGFLLVASSTLVIGLILDRLVYRKTALFFLTVYWFAVAATLGLHNFTSTAFATYVPLAFLVLLAYMRLAFRRV